MENARRIGIDIGGSHISVALFAVKDFHLIILSVIRKEIDSKRSANYLVNVISECIKEITGETTSIEAVGIAFPGPFDYKKGVSAIINVGGKYQHTFGLHMLQALKDGTGLANTQFHFENDANCFALGANLLLNLKSKRTVFLTLGTGFGSSFMEDGSLISKHPSIPTAAAFFCEPFLGSIADDYFSTRWILDKYKELSGQVADSVKDIASSDSLVTHIIFNEFGFNLGNFLLPWLDKFQCDELVIGGNIAKAEKLFHPAFIKQLASLHLPPSIIYTEDTEECILKGAALHAVKEMNPDLVHFKRKTKQPLLPLTSNESNPIGYTVFPSYRTAKKIYTGFDSLAESISNEKLVVIDGYGGVLWENLREQLHFYLVQKNKKIFWYDINTCLKTPEEIEPMISDSLNGDDPVFGKKYCGGLSDFFDAHKLSMIDPDSDIDLCIIYGTGAALANWKGTLVYIDVPKNEIQYRMRAGSINNIGTDKSLANAQIYKRFYFVDWPVLNEHKRNLLSKINYVVDEQRINEITWMNGNDFRDTLNEMVTHPFRARPWFEAGVWGGNWMKQNIAGLNKDEINYAWSFELITPENGIVMEGNSYLMEVSFDFLLFSDNKKLLGKAAERFGVEFPIRFDFLDTYEGGNLSIQCHPRTDYIREKFGESFTQDETYYILDCEPDAKVYLGFQEDINKDEFKTALLNAQQNNVELPIEKYVQKHNAQKHDLFLIPNGTIHASGKNNLVLEISSTPYIFTFKMYDWLRLDLNGQPRPINIEHAFHNLYFDRKGDAVSTELISKPQVEEEWDNGRKVKLPTHPVHFYAVDRYEFAGSIQVNTNNQCQICMLVQGDRIEVITNGNCQSFCYAETFVIPASVKNYELINKGTERAFVVVAYVKEECSNTN